MVVNPNQLFTDPHALTEEQIDIGLEAGVWGEPARPLVQHYLDQMKLKRFEAAAAKDLDAVRSVVDDARSLVPLCCKDRWGRGNELAHTLAAYDG